MLGAELLPIRCRPATCPRAQVRAAAARRTHWLKGILYLPVGIKFWRQGAPGWAIAADATAYLAVTLLLLPTCMALAEVRLDPLLTIPVVILPTGSHLSQPRGGHCRLHCRRTGVGRAAGSHRVQGKTHGMVS